MTDRMDPSETAEVWKGLTKLLNDQLLKPTVFDTEYVGLDSVVRAMKDLSARKVWGKAVVLLDTLKHKPHL
jgi:NADPH2:quinone reductase